MRCAWYMLPLETSVIIVFPGKDTVKNQFYLIILIASLAVCGVMMFRPQTADRVLALFGLQDKESLSSVASKWDDLTADTFPANDTFVLGNVLSFHDNSDGFAVAIPAQPTMPTPQFSPVLDSDVSLEGVAVSSVNGSAMPDFTASPPVPSVPQVSGFEGYNPGVTNPQPPLGASEIAIQFGTSVSDNHDSDAGFAQSLPGRQQPYNQVVSDNTVGFADYTTPYQPVIVPGHAAYETLPLPPATDMSFGGNTPMSDASIVMPDPQFNGGFGDYRPPMTSSELDNRIIPPAEAPAITWGGPNDSSTGHIAQPIMTPEQLAPANAVVPVQGMVSPPGSTQQSSGVPQFQIPAFDTPQSVPPMQQETPLYIPPSGSYGQNPQPMPQVMQQPPPVTTRPIAPSVPQVTQSQPQQERSQSESQSSVTIASATRHELSTSSDRRAQYEPGVLAESETVFATDLLVRVGARDVIMTCDILAELRDIMDNEWAVQYRKIFEEYGQQPSVMEERRYKAEGMQVLFERTLDNWIMLLMLYVDMTLNLPAEQIEEIKKAESKNFDVEIFPKMLEQYGVTNRYDLNEELRKYGTTLDRQKESTIQKRLAQGWFGNIAKQQKSLLTFDDMVGYYEEHKEEKYKIPGQVKWEELAILFSETASEQEAYAKIAELGNRVQKGESFADVARQGSQGLTAYRGGEREATIGSLKTKTLEQAVFSLPVGKMSTIIKEDTGGSNAGFYIVCVTKRQDTHYTPFDHVQGEIQKSINEERFLKEQERVFSEIRKRIPVLKTDKLQQIITMASEAELNVPIDHTPERHVRLIAKAERLDPSGKKDPKEREQMTAAQSQSGAEAQSGEPGTRIARATNRSGTQNSSLPSREGETGKPSVKEDTPKKKTFFQSLNPFK